MLNILQTVLKYKFVLERIEDGEMNRRWYGIQVLHGKCWKNKDGLKDQTVMKTY